jgi:FixJ family two-component response regulator
MFEMPSYLGMMVVSARMCDEKLLGLQQEFIVLKKLRISIIDDDKSVRSSIMSYFRSAGLNVETFDSAESFLASPSCTDTDCLVTDLHMPGTDGLALQRELNRTGREFPVIVMTGFPSDETRQQATELGAAAFLAKPVDPDELLEQVERAVS